MVHGIGSPFMDRFRHVAWEDGTNARLLPALLLAGPTIFLICATFLFVQWLWLASMVILGRVSDKVRGTFGLRLNDV